MRIVGRAYLIIIAIFTIFINICETEAYAQDDVISAARIIMNNVAQKDWDGLWEQTADLYKHKTQVKKSSFVANWALSRGMMGNLTSVSVVDETAAPDPTAPWGYTGKIYTVTFNNSYSNGNFYERVIMIPEDGTYRIVNFSAAAR